MKFIALFLIALTTCHFINEREVQYLKENAPYEVYDVNENPFRDWTEEEIRGLFGVVLEDVTIAGRDGDQDRINARSTLSSLFAMCCNRVADRVGAGSIVDRCSRPEILSLCSCCHRT